MPESARAIVYEAPRRDVTTTMVVLNDGTVEIGGNEIDPGDLDRVDAHLTSIATTHGTNMPASTLPTEQRISDSVLRLRVAADAPLSVVAPVVERALQTLCLTWPGAARMYFDVATPSLKAPRVFPVMLRAIAGMPGKDPGRSYVALRVTSVAALPEGHDAARPWMLTITANAGGSAESSPGLTWDEVKQKVGALPAPSELVLDIPVVATTPWGDVMKLFDQASEVRLDELSIRTAK